MELTDEGMSQREVGKVLGVDHSTVNKDLKAGESPPDSGPQPIETSVASGKDGEFSPQPTEPAGVELALTDEEREQRDLDAAARAAVTMSDSPA